MEGKATRNYKKAINYKSKIQTHNTANKYLLGVYCTPDTWLGSGDMGKQNRHGPESQIVVRAVKKEQEL